MCVCVYVCFENSDGLGMCVCVCMYVCFETRYVCVLFFVCVCMCAWRLVMD